MTDIPLISDPTEDYLDGRTLVDYKDYKERFIDWLENLGKNPKHGEGYAPSSVRQTSYKIDQFYRWLWNERGKYTKEATPEDADAYIKYLVYSEEDYSNSHKASVQKILKRFFAWRRHEFGEDAEWEPEYNFKQSTTQPRDFLTIEERKLIREAALRVGSIPNYRSLTPDERDQWKIYLAQRFQKPKNEITLDDWERANGWKIPSIVWTSLDAGLRPIEVGRAKVSWVDIENSVLRIPKEESSKNRDNWVVGITDRTATALDRWLTERQNYEMYSEREEIWLTREGNPYGSNSLSHLLSRLCEKAEIDTTNRQMGWYAIRHSVGTYMTREQDLAAAQAQLRHRSPETTMRYDQTPVEDRRDTLNKIG